MSDTHDAVIGYLVNMAKALKTNGLDQAACIERQAASIERQAAQIAAQDARLSSVEPTTVYLASTSAVKRAAVELAFPDAKVVVVDCPSGVNPQPCGYLELRTGAANRLRRLHERIPPDARSGNVVFVSMESGVIMKYHSYGRDFDDVGMVMVQRVTAGTVVANMSDAVTAYTRTTPMTDAACVHDVMDSDYQMTYGQAMFNRELCKDAGDPHVAICGVSRVRLFADALRNCM